MREMVLLIKWTPAGRMEKIRLRGRFASFKPAGNVPGGRGEAGKGVPARGPCAERLWLKRMA